MWTKFFRLLRNSHQGFVLSSEVIIGILMCILSLGVFIVFSTEILERDFATYDTLICQVVYLFRTPTLTSIMLVVTMFGSMVPIVLATLISIIFLIKKHRKEVVLFCLALILGTVLNMGLKDIARRDRPQLSPLIIETSYSFPSGHAMNSFIFYALISYFSYHFFRNKKLTLVISILSAAIILLIGFSRIYLGVHYLTDVIAGYIAGFWWFVTILLADHILTFYHFFKKSE